MATIKNYEGELATHLSDYRSLGHKEASKHRPSPDAASPDQHETSLQVKADGWLAAEQHLFDHTVTEASRGVVEAQQKAVELQASVNQLLSDESLASTVDAELAGMRPSLVRTTEARKRAEVDLNYFKATNNIHEEARYPESMPYHFGVLAIAVLAEAAVNTVFFENSQGLLGGSVIALAIAVLNLAAAGLCGIAFRYKNLAAYEMKVLGWCALPAAIFIALLCNALFASFRAQYQMLEDPSDFGQLSDAFGHSWRQAMRFFVGDVRFTDLWSFLLFGIGCLLSVFAFRKGYTIDDRYPGHGALDRLHKKAVAIDDENQELARQKVKELLHQRRTAVQSALHEPTTQLGMLSRRIADLSHARKSLEQRSAAVERDLQLVINAYRQANLAVRGLPPPDYFKTPPTLSVSADSASAQSVVSNLERVQGELKAMGDENRGPLTARLNSLQNDSANVLNQTLSGFFASVRQEAQENISRQTPTSHRLAQAA